MNNSIGDSRRNGREIHRSANVGRRALGNHIRAFAILVFISFGFASSAGCEDRYGTIVVVKISKDQAVVAADTLELGTTRTEDTCKITALGEQIIFASTGKFGFDVSNLWTTISWDAHKEAERAFARRGWPSWGRNDKEPIVRMAWHWVTDASMTFQVAAERKPSVVEPRELDGAIVQGLFLGTGQSGDFVMARARLVVEASGPSPIFKPEVKEQPTQNGLLVYGATAIFEEIYNRGKAERESWEAKLLTEEPERRDLLTAIHLVDLAIRHDKSGTIGGKVDAVVLRRGGRIEWVQGGDRCKH